MSPPFALHRAQRTQPRAAGTTRRPLAILLVLAMAGPWAGCSRTPVPDPPNPPDPPRTEENSYGPIHVSLTVHPSTVRLDRDVLATLRIKAPSEMDIELPPMDNRVQGFLLSGLIDQEPVTRDGATLRERRLLLTPVVAAEYRIAPFAIRYVDRSRNHDLDFSDLWRLLYGPRLFLHRRHHHRPLQGRTNRVQL